MTTDELLLCTMVKLSDRDESTIIIISYVCVMGGYEGRDVEGALHLEKTDIQKSQPGNEEEPRACEVITFSRAG